MGSQLTEAGTFSWDLVLKEASESVWTAALSRVSRSALALLLID